MKEGALTRKTVRFILQCKPSEFGCLNVSLIAAKLNVSTSHLSRTFKADMGICLNRYLLMEKIVRAKFLLKQNQRLRIKDIARIFDFCTCDYFIRIFKQNVGVSPGKYREMANGFFGLKDRRRGPGERRSRYGRSRSQMYENLREKSQNSRFLQIGSLSERRSGPFERRQFYLKKGGSRNH